MLRTSTRGEADPFEAPRSVRGTTRFRRLPVWPGGLGRQHRLPVTRSRGSIGRAYWAQKPFGRRLEDDLHRDPAGAHTIPRSLARGRFQLLLPFFAVVAARVLTPTSEMGSQSTGASGK